MAEKDSPGTFRRPGKSLASRKPFQEKEIKFRPVSIFVEGVWRVFDTTTGSSRFNVQSQSEEARAH